MHAWGPVDPSLVPHWLFMMCRPMTLLRLARLFHAVMEVVLDLQRYGFATSTQVFVTIMLYFAMVMVSCSPCMHALREIFT